jgi:hypothetical protein
MEKRYCPGPVNRRTFLRIGGLGMGALAGGLEPGLTQLLAAEESDTKPNKDFSVILLWANGGPSHLDTFDMKPEAPENYRGEFRPIQTNVPGFEITELLPNLAKMAEQFSVIRSLHHNRNEHSGGTCRFLSGYSATAANPTDGEYPEIASVVSRELEHTLRDIPLFIANRKFYGGGPAYLGAAYSPFIFRGDPNSKDFGVGDLTVADSALKDLQTRQKLLKTFDTFRRDFDRSNTMSALDRFNQRAVAMLTSSRTADAFDLSKEPDAVRDRYGRTSWGQGLLLARRLVESGVRLVQLQATFKLTKDAGRVNNWDDHSVNTDIFKAYRERMPALDQCVPALINDLHQRGLDQNVLFIFCGEFGRTPLIRNQDKATKRPGRDHWSRAMSIFLAGGGLKMGQVIGQTNAKGEHPVQRIMDSNCLLATLYTKFGIDFHKDYHDNSGRPVPILNDGDPIRELL